MHDGIKEVMMSGRTEEEETALPVKFCRVSGQDFKYEASGAVQSTCE